MGLCERAVASPLGPLRLIASGDALVGLYFPGHRGGPPPAGAGAAGHPVLSLVAGQLREYFEGRRLAFALPLAPAGTPFQQGVWRALGAIEPGGTRSYAAIARALGRPDAARAVGAANAGNPISIVVPCHRLVGARGALTGYAGGLERKAWLLAHERAIAGGAPGGLGPTGRRG